MRQLILYIAFLMSMVFLGHGDVSAASNSPYRLSNDRLQKVEQKQEKHEAVLEDASVVASQACSTRPHRLLPSGNIHAGSHAASRLLFYRILFLKSLLFADCGRASRQESAPVHFDVASKYYVICLRHLRC